jgi:carboxylesterase type B
VIVWIHGGGYYWGAGSYSGPTYLLDQDVILVTLNYRLGALGFLSTGDSASPGNYGLKDQSMAIAWIQENIVFFGGDPKRITLIGQSAGAASVHLHLMSPQTKDKLYGAISQSGSALSHWALPPRQLYYFKKLAGSVNCYASTSEGIMNCLRRRTARELIYRQFNLFEWVENPQILFGPVVEPESDSAFITMTPQAYYEKGLVAQIPWITGVTKDEGDLFSLVNYLGPLSTRSLLRNMDTVLPSVLMYNSSENESTNKIRTFYLQEYPKFSFSGFETLKSLSRMVGDRFFYVPFHKTVRIHSNSVRAPLYAYMFSYKGRHGTPEKFQLSPAEWGVMHLDELQYLFNSTELFAPMLKSDKEYPVAKHFIDLWTNFAKTGMPVNPQYANSPSGGSAWKKYSSDSKVFYEINERSKMIQEPDENRINFWKSINHY